MKIYVTVGTTSFDKLIEKIDSYEFYKAAMEKGFTEVVMQIGRGVYEPNCSPPAVRTEHYRFKSSLREDIESADLAISHAGAGSCLEILGASKPLLVVINEELMNNHQLELASKLAAEEHLLYCTCSTLEETLRNFDSTKLKKFSAGQPQKFAAFMEHLFESKPT